MGRDVHLVAGCKTVVQVASTHLFQFNWRVSFRIGLVAANIATAGIACAATKRELAHCRQLDDRIERLACFKRFGIKPDIESQVDDVPQSTKPSAVDKTETRIPEVETTNAINHSGSSSNQPLCASRDALAVALVASLLASDPQEATTVGCRALPADALLEVLERYPSGLSFMRTIKVKVNSRTEPNLTGGFTIELGAPKDSPKQ
jgi:hypothetical protein